MVTVNFHKKSWRNPLSLIISWFTGEVFHHASITVDGVVYEALADDRGVVARKRTLDHHRVLQLPVKPNKGRKAEMTMWLNAQRGKPYDWKYILTWLWRKNSSDRKYICYELVYKALRVGFPHAKLPDVKRIDTWTLESAVAKIRGR